jgi:hypothetical protein
MGQFQKAFIGVRMKLYEISLYTVTLFLQSDTPVSSFSVGVRTKNFMEVQLIMYTCTYSTLKLFVLKIKTYHTKLHEYKSTQKLPSLVIYIKLLIIIFI